MKFILLPAGGFLTENNPLQAKFTKKRNFFVQSALLKSVDGAFYMWYNN